MVGLGTSCACGFFVTLFSISLHVVNDIAYRLGPLELATQSVLLVSASTTFQAPFALGVATSVRCVASYTSRSLSKLLHASIGNLLGEGKALRAGISSNTAIVMALALSVASRYSLCHELCNAASLYLILPAPCFLYFAILGRIYSTMILVSFYCYLTGVA
jgi:hypothetical protein